MPKVGSFLVLLSCNLLLIKSYWNFWSIPLLVLFLNIYPLYLSILISPFWLRPMLDFNLSILFPGIPPALYLSYVWVIYFLTGIFLEFYELVFLLILSLISKNALISLWPSLFLGHLSFRTKVYILYLIIHLFNLVLILDPFELLVT